jgi:hypothetical protein
MRCASLLETVTEKSATPVLAAIKGRRTMKYICLGYYDRSKHEAMTEAEKQAMFDTCFIYDDHLRANGHLGSGELLQPAETALTLYWKNGKVATTDGPYAETNADCIVTQSCAAQQPFIDECLHTSLVEVAHAAGHLADERSGELPMIVPP